MVAHPGMLLTLVMEPSHAVGTLMVLLLGVLAAGSTALLRALSVRTVLAVGVGAAIGLSGPALSYTSNAPYLASLAFWPLVLLSALRLAEGKRASLSGGLALGMALLGGDLPGALLAAVVALVVFRAHGGRLRTEWPRLCAVVGDCAPRRCWQLVSGGLGLAAFRTGCGYRGQRGGALVLSSRRNPGIHLAAPAGLAAAALFLLALSLARAAAAFSAQYLGWFTGFRGRLVGFAQGW
jgi:hypothetical protein